MQTEIAFIQIALLAFWALWFTILWIMNILDALKVMGVLPEEWKAASGNYKIIAKHTGEYHAPEWLNQALYVGVLIWQAIIVAGLWAAFSGSVAENTLLYGRINFAYGSALFLFAVFLLADEVLKIYDTAEQHTIIFIALLVSLLVVTVPLTNP
jgi:hypothetical protein